VTYPGCLRYLFRIQKSSVGGSGVKKTRGVGGVGRALAVRRNANFGKTRCMGRFAGRNTGAPEPPLCLCLYSIIKNSVCKSYLFFMRIFLHAVSEQGQNAPRLLHRRWSGNAAKLPLPSAPVTTTIRLRFDGRSTGVRLLIKGA